MTQDNNIKIKPRLDDRQAIRTLVRARRQSLSIQQQHDDSMMLLSQLSNNTAVLNAQHIAIYLSNDGELSTKRFIQWCWQQRKSVYLPVVHPFSSGHLLFLRYSEATVMTVNRFGISEPKLNVNNIIHPSDLDIIFTPLVAFDSTGARLGMGGGFYDRTLANWHQRYKSNKLAKPFPIGLAHNCQQVEHIPSQHWDIPLPQLFTPSQHFIFS
jgi:5-formyltetrahydrofolate cyclo-ligase